MFLRLYSYLREKHILAALDETILGVNRIVGGIDSEDCNSYCL